MTTQEINKQIQEQFEQFVAPVRKVQDKLIDHAEKVAKLQIETAQSYTDLALTNARDLASLDSVESVQKYLQTAPKTAQQVGEKVVQDGQKFAELGQSVGEDLRQIAQENVAKAGKKGQGAKKAAA